MKSASVYIIAISLIILTTGSVSASLLADFTPRADQPFELIKLSLQAVTSQRTEDEEWKPINSTKTIRDSSGGKTEDFVQSPPGGTAGSSAGSIQPQTEHFKVVELKVKVNTTEHILELKINKYLLRSDYKEFLMSGGRVQLLMSNASDIISTHCYYTGSVKGHNGSIAAVSTCNGIVGFFKVEGITYYIEPSGGEACLSCSHKVYTADPKHPHSSGTYHCGVQDDVHEDDHLLSRIKRALISEFPQDLDGTTRLVELYVVNDHYQYLNKSSNSANVISRAKNIINMASAIFQQEDIYLIIVGMETWADTQRITATTDANQFLNDFKSYVTSSVTQSHDCACLFTALGPFGFQGSNSVVGLASTGAMCGASSQFFTADIYPAAAVAGAITAHECGHVFGLDHDNLPQTCPCNASDPNGNCIMNSATDVGTPATQWSPCSKAILHSSDNYNKYTCLYNKPTTVFDPASFCGNGLVEPGEDCDCGWAPKSECNPNCCSNVTCKLINNAQCAFGKCCDIPQCKYNPRYTECRAASGQCDLSEYCSGSSPFCPSDIYKADFTPCTAANSEASYCYNNRCETRQTRCQVVYGSGAVVGQDICYTDANKRGDARGNCGFLVPNNYTVYKPCTTENGFCGQLQCDGTVDLQSTPGFISAGWVSYITTTTIYCQSAVFQPDPVYGLRGHVPNGTPCGTGKACQDQLCSDLTVLKSGKTCTTCSGNGVCNTLDQCHCNKGFGSADCSQTGEGGSLHSNGIAALPTTIAASTTTTTVLTTNKPATTTVQPTTTTPITTSKVTTKTAKVDTTTAKSETTSMQLTSSAPKPTTSTNKPPDTTFVITTTMSANATTPLTTGTTTTTSKSPNVTNPVAPTTTTTGSNSVTNTSPTTNSANASTFSIPTTSSSLIANVTSVSATTKPVNVTNLSTTSSVNVTNASPTSTTTKSVNVTNVSGTTLTKSTISTGSDLSKTQTTTAMGSTTEKSSDSNKTAIIIIVIVSVLFGIATIGIILFVCGRSSAGAVRRPVARLEPPRYTSPFTESQGPTLRFVPAYRVGN